MIHLLRKPVGRLEETAVNGFRQVDLVDEIWIRYVPAQITNTYPKCRIYLGFRLFTEAARTKADHLEAEFRQHMYYERYDFEVRHIAAGSVPIDQPSCVWMRPRANGVPPGGIA
jgi:hypothetical protein